MPVAWRRRGWPTRVVAARGAPVPLALHRASSWFIAGSAVSIRAARPCRSAWLALSTRPGRAGFVVTPVPASRRRDRRMAVAHRDIVAASMGPACRCPLRARRHGDRASAMRNAFRELAWSAFHCRVRNAHRSRYEADTKPIQHAGQYRRERAADGRELIDGSR
ncbi:hypothetical protein [Burkholderia pseudomallei]|uniref:hypothetical protein n=1 Tax=Burkholderia pseudomallei TaxID=28450 RepID=UPI000A1CA92D|nr:hypothetical protein [Burkholderia pseudomallei]